MVARQEKKDVFPSNNDLNGEKVSRISRPFYLTMLLLHEEWESYGHQLNVFTETEYSVSISKSAAMVKVNIFAISGCERVRRENATRMFWKWNVLILPHATHPIFTWFRHASADDREKELLFRCGFKITKHPPPLNLIKNYRY